MKYRQRMFSSSALFGSSPQHKTQETIPHVRGGSTTLLWQVTKRCSKPPALLEFTFLVSLFGLYSIYFFHHSLCSYFGCSYHPNQDPMVQAREKDEVGTSVLYLENCVLSLEDSIVLAHQRRNPVCLCKFRVTLQRMSFSGGHQEQEKTKLWLRMQLAIFGDRRSWPLASCGWGPLVNGDVTGVLASLPDMVFVAPKQQATDPGLTKAFCGETESESVWVYYGLQWGNLKAGRLRLWSTFFHSFVKSV